MSAEPSAPPVAPSAAPAPARMAPLRQLDNLRTRVGLGILLSGLMITGAATWAGAGMLVGNQRAAMLSELASSAEWRAELAQSGQLRAASTPRSRERLVWLDPDGLPLSSADRALELRYEGNQLSIYDAATGRNYLGSGVSLSQAVEGSVEDFFGGGGLADGARSPGERRQAARLLVMGSSEPLIAARQQLSLGALSGLLASLVLAGLGGGLLARQSEREISELRHDAHEALRNRTSSPGLPLTGSPELQAVRATFNEMLRDLQAVIQRQDSFLSDVSHELRSPITAIHGHARMILRRHNPAPESMESLGIIVRESERMGRMVSDLMDLQRQEIRNHDGPVEVVSLDELARRVQAMDPERHNSDGQPVTVSVEGQASAPGDPDRLLQVMINLTNNAVAAGATEVRLQLSQTPECACLEVRDNGRGIAPGDLPHVFERFYRADDSRQRNRGGTGLGLAITVMIVRRLHRGEIQIDSPGVGQGATVSITLPRAPASGPEAAPAVS